MKLRELVTQTQPAHKDERRIIWEPINGFPIQRVNFFYFQGATKPGGNHFHKRNEEIFLLVRGLIKIMILEDTNTKERAVFENLYPGTKIHVPPGVAHALFFEPGSMMLAGCTAPFDPNDEDHNPYPLINEKGVEIPPDSV